MQNLKSYDKSHCLTVSELNQLVGSLLEDAFPAMWIEGEISNLTQPASQHLYFSLKDAKAHVRCAMFKRDNRHLPFKPENGQHVLVYAKIGLYEPRGDFQLIVEFMEPAGDGKLRLQFEQLKLKLSQEGLFEERFKKPLPALSQTIGIITSPTGAALRDILTVLKRRAAQIAVIIYPTLVQGTEAAAQIVKALEIANTRAEVDVLILARGGGSLEDLWPFNEESVARAIFASTLPIITGIGHEIDWTIADFVADKRAPTPSAAAELTSCDRKTEQKQLLLFEKRIWENIDRILQRFKDQLSQLITRLKHPQKRLQEWSQKTDELYTRLFRLMQQSLEYKRQKLLSQSHLLDTISPLATLKRGYAIVRNEDRHIIKTSAETHAEQILEVLLGQGSVHCEVLKS